MTVPTIVSAIAAVVSILAAAGAIHVRSRRIAALKVDCDRMRVLLIAHREVETAVRDALAREIPVQADAHVYAALLELDRAVEFARTLQHPAHRGEP